MRPIWKGTISFGLVSIPVKLYSAVKDSTLDLDMLDERDLEHIKYKRINERTGREVPLEHIVKGYLYNGDYVVLNEEDFLEADAEKPKTIDILSVADQSAIDSIYYEQPYYVVPEAAGAKAYAVLREALTESERVGVTMFVMRNKAALAILKPYKKAIILQRIRFQEEILDYTTLGIPPVSTKKTKEQTVADKLIDQLQEPFKIAQYKDTYTAKLLKIVKEKAKGKRRQKVVPKPKIVHKASKDLMEVLKASITEKKRKRAA